MCSQQEQERQNYQHLILKLPLECFNLSSHVAKVLGLFSLPNDQRALIPCHSFRLLAPSMILTFKTNALPSLKLVIPQPLTGGLASSR